MEYAVSRGLQLFMISWRNPGPDMGGLGMDSYAARILSAMDVVGQICGTPDGSGHPPLQQAPGLYVRDLTAG